MKHFIILDDKQKLSKAFVVVAKSIKGIKVLNAKQFAALEDKILYTEMKKAEKSPLLSLPAFKKQIRRILAKKV